MRTAGKDRDDAANSRIQKNLQTHLKKKRKKMGPIIELNTQTYHAKIFGLRVRLQEATDEVL